MIILNRLFTANEGIQLNSSRWNADYDLFDNNGEGGVLPC